MASMRAMEEYLRRLRLDPHPRSELSERSHSLQNENRLGNHVYDYKVERNVKSIFCASEMMDLPIGSKQDDSIIHEEVTIPIAPEPPKDVGRHKVQIADLDEIGQKAFRGMTELNQIQSVVFDAAYNTDQNLLVCAPTGSGKTNIALLAVVNEIKKNIHRDEIQTHKFKIIYIAPMKALASEMTRNFRDHLKTLGIRVRELTGDMQLTKTQIAETQMIITTPEKWDVVTRKKNSSDGFTEVVRLMIIDEVHLLYNERGAVIESLVARTRREIESKQRRIRLVALSATLPNYKDVAEFLDVDTETGMFYFDARFRPVPLLQKFVGAKGARHKVKKQNMEKLCYDMVEDAIRDGHQVLVFVFSRNATVGTARQIQTKAKTRRLISELRSDQQGHERSHLYSDIPAELAEKIAKSRNKTLKDLLEDGLGIHHAGMLREDRNLVEKLFEDGYIKVLCCTSTLAWGVNLPAHTVVINGTEFYDAAKGGFIDIDIIEVCQIFGRAGRPQFDTSGTAVLITKHERLNNFLSLLTRQKAIESQFLKNLNDHLNAEICLQTVENVADAVEWLQYTFLNIRMRKNPSAYIPEQYRSVSSRSVERFQEKLIKKAAKELKDAYMIHYDEPSGRLITKGNGETASHFYITYKTMVKINTDLVARMSERSIFSLLAKAEEFQPLKVRDEEKSELAKLYREVAKYGKQNTETSYSREWKFVVLLHTHIFGIFVETFSLVSDCNYIAPNAGRILRGMFEIAIASGYPKTAIQLINLAKAVDNQLWEGGNPLKYFRSIKPNVIDKFERKGLDYDSVKDLDVSELAQILDSQDIRPVILALRQIPSVKVTTKATEIEPRKSFRVEVVLTPTFEWNDRVHDTGVEMFWVWMDCDLQDKVYFAKKVSFDRDQVLRANQRTVIETVTISPSYRSAKVFRIWVVSNRWTSVKQSIPLEFSFSY